MKKDFLNWIGKHQIFVLVITCLLLAVLQYALKNVTLTYKGPQIEVAPLHEGQ